MFSIFAENEFFPSAMHGMMHPYSFSGGAGNTTTEYPLFTAIEFAPWNGVAPHEQVTVGPGGSSQIHGEGRRTIPAQ